MGSERMSMDALRIQNGLSQSGVVRDAKSLEVAAPQRQQIANEIGGQSTTGSFAETLGTALNNVNQMQKDADKGMQNLATGRTDNVADVMLATEKADIAVKLMVQVRNKIIDAYQEVMRMQV